MSLILFSYCSRNPVKVFRFGQLFDFRITKSFPFW